VTHSEELRVTNSENMSRAISEHAGGVTIRVYAAPRSSANSVVGIHAGEIKVSLTAPPVEGAANKALVEFLAKKLGVPKSALSLVSGETSRHKVLRVEGLSARNAIDRLTLGD
jgi:uncharacterized protein (TIGR00251 family)